MTQIMKVANAPDSVSASEVFESLESPRTRRIERATGYSLIAVFGSALGLFIAMGIENRAVFSSPYGLVLLAGGALCAGVATWHALLGQFSPGPVRVECKAGGILLVYARGRPVAVAWDDPSFKPDLNLVTTVGSRSGFAERSLWLRPPRGAVTRIDPKLLHRVTTEATGHHLSMSLPA
jgi:hypothetical protein